MPKYTPLHKALILVDAVATVLAVAVAVEKRNARKGR